MAIVAPKLKVTFSNKVLRELAKRLKDANAYVTVGIQPGAGVYKDGTDLVMVALCNEFGTADIPERSFIRSAVRDNTELINRWRIEVLRGVIADKLTVAKALQILGFRVQVLIQNRIKSNIQPENAPRTAAQKKRDGVPQRTLIHTSLMLRSIAYQIYEGAEASQAAE